MNRLRFTLILGSIGLIAAMALLVLKTTFAQVPLTAPGIQVPDESISDKSATVTFTTSVPTCAYVTYSTTSPVPAGASKVYSCEALGGPPPYPTVTPQDNFGINLNGLNPSTTYHFTVTLTDTVGVIIGSPSAEQDFTTVATPSSVTPTIISNITVDNITETTAEINFSTDQPAGQFIDCMAVNYGLRPTTTYPNRQSHCYTADEKDAAVDEHQHHIDLANLMPSRVYDFNVWIVDANGTRTSALSSFTTPGSAPTPTGPLNSSSAAITAVNVDFVNATDAAISFKYSSSVPLGTLCYRAVYGRTTSYEKNITSQSLDPTTGSKKIPLPSLDPGTAYHFVVQLVKRDGGGSCTDEVVVASADRSFTTGSGISDQGNLLINSIRLDCIDTSCVVYYSTNRSATVEIRWAGGGTGANTSFDDYGYGTTEAAPSSGARTVRIPDGDPAAPVFVRNTMYKYRLRATDAGGAQNTTSQLSFTTSASSTDHTFATGACTVGLQSYDIGTCYGTQYCQSAATFVEDCMQCGFLCEAGKTCRTGVAGGTCELDAPLIPGSAVQCNNSACYEINGALKNPARAGCYSTWPNCNANTVLSVRKDRGCNLWLTCGMSVQIDGRANAPSENICFSLATCNSLNTRGQCNHYLPLGQCNNDPVRFCSRNADCQDGGTCNSPSRNDPTRAIQTATFQTPKDIAKIANLSGEIIVGLDWGQQGGMNVIQGMLPWQLMSQIGTGTSSDTWKNIMTNGDFEYNGPNPWPWNGQSAATIQVDFEDREAGPNHVLLVDPEWNDNADWGGESGAISQPFTASATEYYYLEARVRSNLTGVPAKIKMQFALDNGNTDVASDGTWAATVVKTTDTWQTISIGPIKGIYGSTTVRFVCFSNPDASRITDQKQNVTRDDGIYCNNFEIDDVIVKPVLQINNNPNYITPSCRLYPKTSSPACDYVDEGGIVYNGWKGYCLEHDSVTGTCISWWPVDMIKGESSLFGAEKTAGYADRVPLFMCAEAEGSAPYTVTDTARPASTVPIVIANLSARSCSGGAFYTIGWPFTFAAPNFTCVGCHPLGIDWYNPVGAQVGLRDFEITRLTLEKAPNSNGNSLVWPNIVMNTDSAGNVIPEPPYPNGLYNDDTPLIPNTTNNIGEGATPGSAGIVDPRDSNTHISQESWLQVEPTQLNRRVHCDDSAGCKVWVAQTITGTTDPSPDTVHNYIEFYVVFGRTNGTLERFGVVAKDRSGSTCEPGTYQLTFHLGEVCTKIVQVVDESGANRAFSSRVVSSSYHDPADFFPTLATPELLQSKDPAPFSSVILPEGYPDPTGAPAVRVEAIYPSLPQPGQPRSGAYACSGTCNQSVLIGGGSPISNKGPQSFTTAQCVGGRCTGGSCDAQLPADCDKTESVTSEPSLNVPAAVADARNKCGLAVSGTGPGNRLACDGDVGSCTGEKRYYDAFIRNPALDVVADGLTTVTGTCSVTHVIGDPNSYYHYMQGNPVVGAVGTVPPTCTENAHCRATWDDYTDLSPIPDNPALGTTSKYFAQERIKRIFAQSYGIWTLQGGVYTKVQNSDAGSDNFVGWNPPDEICPLNTTPIDPAGGIRAKYVRPPYVGKEPIIATPPLHTIDTQQDYCGIPPEVFNTKFGVGLGRSVTIIGGSGNVAIKFNTSVDSEQMPLREIRVDWGDSQDTISYPYAPRPDPAKPHILSHVYVMSNGLAEDCPVDDSGRVVCEFHIKIQVVDKWGWCNDAHANGNLSSHICHETRLGDGQYDTSEWFDTGLSVKVEP